MTIFLVGAACFLVGFLIGAVLILFENTWMIFFIENQIFQLFKPRIRIQIKGIQYIAIPSETDQEHPVTKLYWKRQRAKNEEEFRNHK